MSIRGLETSEPAHCQHPAQCVMRSLVVGAQLSFQIRANNSKKEELLAHPIHPFAVTFLPNPFLGPLLSLSCTRLDLCLAPDRWAFIAHFNNNTHSQVHFKQLSTLEQQNCISCSWFSLSQMNSRSRLGQFCARKLNFCHVQAQVAHSGKIKSLSLKHNLLFLSQS